MAAPTAGKAVLTAAQAGVNTSGAICSPECSPVCCQNGNLEVCHKVGGSSTRFARGVPLLAARMGAVGSAGASEGRGSPVPNVARPVTVPLSPLFWLWYRLCGTLFVIGCPNGGVALRATGLRRGPAPPSLGDTLRHGTRIVG